MPLPKLPGEVTAGADGNPTLDRLRRLAAMHWSPAITAATAATSAILVVWKLLFNHRAIDAQTWAGFVAAMAIVFLLRYPRVATRITRLILPPATPSSHARIFRGPRPYTEDDANLFFGRRNDLEQCYVDIMTCRLLIIEGESACGKTSFVRAGLLARLADRYCVLRCQTSSNLLEALAREIGKLITVEEGAASNETGDPLELLQVLCKQAALPVLICLDQFDEIFALVAEDRRRVIFDAIIRMAQLQNVTLVLVIRQDYEDLLGQALRHADPSGKVLRDCNFRYFTLNPFTIEQASEVMMTMFRAAGIVEPIAEQDFRDFSVDLARQLARPSRDRRLARDSRETVLAIDLQIVGQIAEQMSFNVPTRTLLQNVGGAGGLYKAYVESVILDVWRYEFVTGTDCIAILRALISPTGERVVRSGQEIAQGLGKPPELVARTLSRLDELAIVRRVPGKTAGRSAEDSELSYELMHARLVRVLEEAPEQHLQERRDAESRLRFWMERSDLETLRVMSASTSRNPASHWLRRVRLRLLQPIPIREALYLRKFTVSSKDRVRLAASRAAFATRLAVAAGAAAAISVACLFLTLTDYAQIRFILREVPDSQLFGTLGWTDETKAWSFALAHIGQGKKLAGLIADVKGADNRARYFALAAVECARAGDTEAAWAFWEKGMAERPSGWNEDLQRGLQSIVRTSIASTASQRFLAHVMTLPLRTGVRAYVAMYAAEIMSDRGDRELANRLWSVADQSTDSISIPEVRSELLRDRILVARKVALGALPALREELFRVDEEIQDPNNKSNAYFATARIAAETGDYDEALEGLRRGLAVKFSLWNIDETANLEAFGNALALGGRLEDVEQILAKCSSENSVLCQTVASSLSEGAIGVGSGGIDAALRVVGDRRDLEWSTRALRAARAVSCRFMIDSVWPLTLHARAAAGDIRGSGGRIRPEYLSDPINSLLACGEGEKAVSLIMNSDTLGVPSAAFGVSPAQVMIRVIQRGGQKVVSGRVALLSGHARCAVEEELVANNAAEHGELLPRIERDCIPALTIEPELMYVKREFRQTELTATAKFCAARPAAAALDCARLVRDSQTRDDLLGVMAVLAAGRMQAANAYRFVGNIVDPASQSGALADVEIAFAGGGHLDEVNLGATPQYSDDRSRVMCAVASVYASVGDLRNTRDSSRGCMDPRKLVAVYAKAIDSYARRNNELLRKDSAESGAVQIATH